MNELVSIVMPCYNSDSYIKCSIESVINQTYSNWELVIIDDCSTDNSYQIINSFCEKDKRIIYFKTNFPSGSPTIPRNIGIMNSRGRYIAFLDSDDIWAANKLENQICLFDNDLIAIVFSNYEKISENGCTKNRIVIAPNLINYKQLLYGNVIACCTCVIDTSKSGKLKFNNQGHEDYALWLKILRRGFYAKNSGLVLASYRVRESSVSSNKLKVISWIYFIFRKNEKLSKFSSLYFTFTTLYKSFVKYLK
jgi:glycosyltransferase involved in cell wall biosynthesis